MITCNTVSCVYEDSINARTVRALDAVSFSVQKGEFVSVVGPSGCGKTTLINMIAGFVPCSSGTITFEGKPITGPSPSRIVVFQDHTLFDWMSVSSNIEFGLRAQNMNAHERKTCVQRYIELVHLKGFEKSFPFQLSGGMKQRVSLARALVVNPDCILMDEPLGSLDPFMRGQLQEELFALWKATGKTILMVTHDIEEALFLSQRIVILDKRPGRIKHILSVPLRQPRISQIKLSDEFQQLKRSIDTIMSQGER